MIIVKLQGGLGNQLYEYALYRRLQLLGKEVYLDDIDYTDRAFVRDIREIELQKLGLTDKLNFCTLKQHYSLCDDGRDLINRARRKIFGNHSSVLKEGDRFEDGLQELDNVYLDGFWQCQKYYEDCLSVIRDEIDFGDKYSRDNAKILEEIRNDKDSVSLHIRLTDYVKKESTYGGICTEAYYQSAINYVKSMCDNPHFYIFSDDIEAAKKQVSAFGISGVFVDCNTSENSHYDMMLMANCHHNICANSSFSIWGATLNKRNDKIVIKPLKANNNTHVDMASIHEMWRGWTIIDERGKVYIEC